MPSIFTLIVERKNSKKKQLHIGISSESPEITLYLPENEYNELTYQVKRLISTLIINGSSKDEIRSLLHQLPDYTVLMDNFENIYTEACNETK